MTDSIGMKKWLAALSVVSVCEEIAVPRLMEDPLRDIVESLVEEYR